MGIFLENKRLIIFLILLSYLPAKGQTFLTPVYNVNNLLWHFDSSQEYFIVVKNNKSCTKCFKELSSYLYDSLHQQNIYFLSRIDSSVFARKTTNRENLNLFDFIKESLFEYRNRFETPDADVIRKGSIFEHFNIEVTPALIQIKNNKYIYYSYKELFTNNGYKSIPYKPA